MNKQKIKPIFVFLCIFLAAAGIRFFCAVTYINWFDLGNYNVPWAIYGADDIFGIYGPTLQQFFLDYPPIFPFCLALLGKPILYAHTLNLWGMEMFYLKLIPILADLTLIVLIYFISRGYKLKPVWLPALLWALNPAVIYNCAFWGQTDCILLFFVLAMVWALQEDKPFIASVAFALGCLSKLQMGYFAPVLIVGLICKRTGFWRAVAALCTGALVGFLGWFPFMRRGEWFALPMRIYFGGFGKYPYVNAHAANIFALGDLYGIPDDTAIFGNFTFSNISTLAVVLALVWLAFYAWVRLKKNSMLPFSLAAMLYCDIIFLFSTRQHERYQLPVLVLALLCCMQTKKLAHIIFAAGITLVTFTNQFILLSGESWGDAWYAMIAPTIRWCAVVNIALFVYLLYDTVRTLMQEQKAGGIGQ